MKLEKNKDRRENERSWWIKRVKIWM